MPNQALHLVSGINANGTQNAASSPETPITLFADNGHVRRLEDIESDLLRLALIKNGGCVRKAAAELRIARSTFYQKLASWQSKAQGSASLGEKWGG